MFNNFIPMRVYTYKDYTRFQVPWTYDYKADKFVFEEYEPFQQVYRLVRTIWVMNIRVLPPTPRGAQVFSVHHSRQFPYEMRSISPVFFNSRGYEPDADSFLFVAYVLAVDGTKELRYRNTFEVYPQYNYEIREHVSIAPQPLLPSGNVPYSLSFFYHPHRPPAFWRCTT